MGDLTTGVIIKAGATEVIVMESVKEGSNHQGATEVT